MTTQKGEGEGTASRIERRVPIRAERPVTVTDAPGLTLGEDGLSHPLETSPLGELRVTTEKADQIIDALERIQMQLSIITKVNFGPGEGES